MFIQTTELSDHSKEKESAHNTIDKKLVTINEESKLDEFNLSLKIHSEDEDSIDNDNVKNIKYLPNKDFQFTNNGSIISSPNSIPNTFKNKSHPNAKTKSELGTSPEVLTQSPQFKPPIIRKISTHNDDIDDLAQHLNDEPIKTSTINKLDNEKFNKTPDWMPSELNEKWIDDFSSSVRITKKSSDLNIPNFNLNSGSNSIIHNSNSIKTPIWKKVKQDYEENQPNLQHFFNNIDKSNSMSSTLSTPYNTNSHLRHPYRNINNNTQQNQDTDNDEKINLTKVQVDELKEILKDKPDDYLIEISNASPLKLFGNNYNTFTKGKLNEIISNLKAPTFNLDLNQALQNSNEPVKEPESEEIEEIEEEVEEVEELVKEEKRSEDEKENAFLSSSIPKLKTNKYDNNDIEEKFRLKANNIFDNIQKRGQFLNQHRSVSSMRSPYSRSASGTIGTNTIIPSNATATSTPKVNKVNTLDELNEYSSFTSGFNQDTTQFQQNTNDYTSFSESIVSSKSASVQSEHNFINNSNVNSMRSHLNDMTNSDVSNSRLDTMSNFSNQSPKLSPNNLKSLQDQLSKKSSYTFDEESINRSTNSHNDELKNKIKELEATVNSFKMYSKNMESLIDENNNLRNELSHQILKNEFPENSLEIDDYDFTNDQSIHDFKLKRISQLKLQAKNNIPHAGNLKPNMNLPNYYDNMVLDEENHRWIMKDTDNFHDTLESIEDLISEQEEEDEQQEEDEDEEEEEEDSIFQDSDPEIDDSIISKNHSKNVSFHLPHSNQVNISPLPQDITRLSQIDELSFSQQQKKLVSIITDALMEINNNKNWNQIEEIDLEDLQLTNIKDLKHFLPNLIRLNLSNNNVKFLKGLPLNLLNLNLNNNDIKNLTSFNDFTNLQNLSLSNNHLVNCNNLQRNIHLIKLNLSNNNLTNIDGLRKLSNLIELDLSLNNLKDDIDFSKFNFENLQILNMAENQIVSVNNLQNLKNLRVLNVNENNLQTLHCKGKHPHLKKLLIKFNKLKSINFSNFPYLRILRIDGNDFQEVRGKLKYIDEISCKSQSDLMLNKLNEFQTLKSLDLSGNLDYFSHMTTTFPNLNKLNLSAINLTNLNINFNEIFPNLIELNLNFNKLNSLEFLKDLKFLKRIYLVSNNLTKIEEIIKNLRNSRLSLKVLDFRLNSLNLEFYPYVFNPQELEINSESMINENFENLIQLETLDDIENFAIHYESLNNNPNDWESRNETFIKNLKHNKYKKRLNYQTLLINYFPNLKKLDGSMIDNDKRMEFEINLKK